MPDYANKALKWIDHNRYFFLGIIGALLLAAFTYGCEATGTFRGEEVTAVQLDQKVSASLADLDARKAVWSLEGDAIRRNYATLEADTTVTAEEIEAKQAVFDKITTDAGTVITGAMTGNPASQAQIVGLALGWLGLLGVGKAADKKRTDGVLARVKTANGGTLPI